MTVRGPGQPGRCWAATEADGHRRAGHARPGLVAQVKITGPGQIIPMFRIPQVTGTGQADIADVPGVRAMTNLVGGAAGTRTQDRRIMSPLL